MMPRFLLAFVLFVLTFPHALASDQLYTGQVPAGSSSDGADEPILAALNQVLVRISGRVGERLTGELGLGANDALNLALARQFIDVEVYDDFDSPRTERWLRVDFDSRSVNRLLEDAGIARWGRERPEMLLWVATDGARGATFLEEDVRVERALEAASFRYGLPLMRPILDASDRIEVAPADVRGGFTDEVESARRRYGADGVILLDLRESDQFWTGRWVWRLGDNEQAFERSGATRQEVVELGLARIAAGMSSRFAVRPEAPRRRQIVVSGVDRALHYAELKSFFERLTGVQNPRLVAASDSSLTFELESTANGLQQRMELLGLLRFEHHDIETGTLRYVLDL